jgi:Family of unknown function (DUF6311)
MISEKQAVRPIEGRAQRLGRLVLVELPAGQLLVLTGSVGTLWAASLFGWSFVVGQHPFWQFPKGTIGGSQYDMAMVLVAYFYFVQSPWHLPLFYISALGTLTGTNIVFMDVVPIVALAGKLVHSLTGATINPYGAYLFLSVGLPGVMMTLVLIAAKTRYALAAIIGAIFANAMPALLWRWGHIALGSHFLLIGALALYLFSLQKSAWRGLAAAWIAWLAVAYLTNIYLFLMVGTVWLCAIIQRRLDGLTMTREALGIGALTVVAVTIVIALSGGFGAGGGLPFEVYGRYSMNLLSPFLPQQSGLVPGLGGVIDATGGQYEGFNYLGLGLLLASILMLPLEAGWLRRNLRRHVSLLVAFAALTAFAISHRVFAGHWLLFELPMPRFLNPVLGIFRSSGRFFWLIGYAQVAMVVVLASRRAKPVLLLCLAGAAILQLSDVQPLREQIIASIAAGPGVEELDRVQVARLVTRARLIEVIPSFQCTSDKDEQRMNMELMLAAARANVPTNTVARGRESYGLSLIDVLRAPSRFWEMLQARTTAYCAQEVEQARRGGRPGDIFVLLSSQPREQELTPGLTCSPLSRAARYCEILGGS